MAASGMEVAVLLRSTCTVGWVYVCTEWKSRDKEARFGMCSLGDLGHEILISKHDLRGGTGGATAHSLATRDVCASCVRVFCRVAGLRSVDDRDLSTSGMHGFSAPIFRHRRDREGLDIQNS